MRLNPLYGWNQMSSAARAIRIIAGVAIAAFGFWTLSPLFKRSLPEFYKEIAGQK